MSDDQPTQPPLSREQVLAVERSDDWPLVTALRDTALYWMGVAEGREAAPLLCGQCGKDAAEGGAWVPFIDPCTPTCMECIRAWANGENDAD